MGSKLIIFPKIICLYILLIFILPLEFAYLPNKTEKLAPITKTIRFTIRVKPVSLEMSQAVTGFLQLGLTILD